MNTMIFHVSTPLAAVARVIDVGHYNAEGAPEGEDAFLLARGLHQELIAAAPDLDPHRKVDLLAGAAWRGLESRNIPYHPQEMLSAIEAVGFQDPTQRSELMAAIFTTIGEPARVRNLVLLSTGVIVSSAERTGQDPAERIDYYRKAFMDSLSPVDWDAEGAELQAEEEPGR